MRNLLKMGAPARKLVLGVPFYGRTYFLQDPETVNVLGAPANNDGFPGPFTQSPGFMGYNEVCYIFFIRIYTAKSRPSTPKCQRCLSSDISSSMFLFVMLLLDIYR